MTISPGEGMKNPFAVKKQHMLEYINMIVWNLNIAKWSHAIDTMEFPQICETVMCQSKKKDNVTGIVREPGQFEP